MIQVTICLVFAFLTFSVIKWEKLLKEKKWLVYSVSLGSVALIEGIHVCGGSDDMIIILGL